MSKVVILPTEEGDILIITNDIFPLSSVLKTDFIEICQENRARLLEIYDATYFLDLLINLSGDTRIPNDQ